MDFLPDPIMDSLLTDDLLDGIAEDLSAAALAGEASQPSQPTDASGQIAGVIRVPLTFPAPPTLEGDSLTAPAVAEKKHLALTFITTPKALFLNLNVVRGPVPSSASRVTTSAAPASSSMPLLPSRNLVVATPALGGSASEPAVSCLLVEPDTEESLLEGLARRFCSKLGRMILLSCDFGVSSVASNYSEGAEFLAAGPSSSSAVLTPLEERKAQNVALQTVTALLG